MAAEAKYDMTVYPMTMAVRSASNGARAHLVQVPWCDCEDFTNRKGRLTEDGSVTICKHIREALERVGGWHRAEPAPLFFSALTHTAVKELLVSSLVGFSPREANAVIVRAGRESEVSFKASIAGLLADGSLTYDKLASRYSLTVTR
jgi:hypothetical protein